MMNLRQQEQRICRKSEPHIDAAFKKSKCCEVGVDERLLLMKLNRLNRFPSTVLLACCMCSLYLLYFKKELSFHVTCYSYKMTLLLC